MSSKGRHENFLETNLAKKKWWGHRSGLGKVGCGGLCTSNANGKKKEKKRRKRNRENSPETIVSQGDRPRKDLQPDGVGGESVKEIQLSEGREGMLGDPETFRPVECKRKSEDQNMREHRNAEWKVCSGNATATMGKGPVHRPQRKLGHVGTEHGKTCPCLKREPPRKEVVTVAVEERKRKGRVKSGRTKTK